MSVAAGLAGYLVAFLVLLYGFALGPDPEKLVNLNFQITPLVLKFLLKPFFGGTGLTEQPDPFADPITMAFPSNPFTIGGIIGLLIVSLNLLPLGRLDGGTIAKALLGGRSGTILGVLAALLVAVGAIDVREGGLYGLFGFYVAVFQNGSESPPKDALTEADASLQALGAVLLILGALISIPGVLMPNL